MRKFFTFNSLLVVIFIGIFFSFQLYLHLPSNVLSWDLYGAYLYLPATFIYDDVFLNDMSWIEQTNNIYNNTPTFYQFWLADTGNQVIKYPTGFAVIYAPFFFAAHVYAHLMGHAPDGFSTPYQVAIIVGHWLYIVLGLVIARKVLLHFFTDRITALLLLIVFFGTNYYFTTIAMVGMPYGHLFMMYGFILWFTIKWHQNPSYFNSVALGLALGLAGLIRATEVVAILIPLLWNVYNKESLKAKVLFFKHHLKTFSTTVLVFCAVGCIQLLYFKGATGHFFIDSYNNAGEGFDFLNPHIIEFLFSYRKGWFIYTPIMLLACAGIYFVWKQKSPFRGSLLTFSVVTLYVLSSWTCWWYAESFGQRSVVQYYLIFIIAFGFLLQFILQKQKWKRYLFGTVVLLLVVFNQFQTWQVHHGLIHLSRMTSEAYWEHFLATSSSAQFEQLLLIDKSVPAKDRLTNEANLYKQVKIADVTFDNDQWSPDIHFDSLRVGCLVTNENVYSKDIAIRYVDITSSDFVIIKVEALIFVDENCKVSKPTLVGKMRHKGKGYYEQYLEVDGLLGLEVGKWNRVEMVFYSPDVRHPKNDLQVFGWLRGQGSFRMDNLIISKYEKI